MVNLVCIKPMCMACATNSLDSLMLREFVNLTFFGSFQPLSHPWPAEHPRHHPPWHSLTWGALPLLLLRLQVVQQPLGLQAPGVLALGLPLPPPSMSGCLRLLGTGQLAWLMQGLLGSACGRWRGV